jgi:hypothetical protein
MLAPFIIGANSGQIGCMIHYPPLIIHACLISLLRPTHAESQGPLIFGFRIGFGNRVARKIPAVNAC